MTQSSESLKQKTDWRFLISFFVIIIGLYLLGTWLQYLQYSVQEQNYRQYRTQLDKQHAKENQILGKKLDDYAIPIIDAIERYKNEHKKYPENLTVLVPTYLSESPYAAFGEDVNYWPEPHQFGPPFYFGFSGSDSILSLNGWSYIYCPSSICAITRYTGIYRINENWIFIHGSW